MTLLYRCQDDCGVDDGEAVASRLRILRGIGRPRWLSRVRRGRREGCEGLKLGHEGASPLHDEPRPRHRVVKLVVVVSAIAHAP